MNLMISAVMLKNDTYVGWEFLPRMLPLNSAKLLMPKIDFDYYLEHPDQLPFNTNEVFTPNFKYKLLKGTAAPKHSMGDYFKDIGYWLRGGFVLGQKNKPIGIYNVGRAAAKWWIDNGINKSLYRLILTSFNNDGDFKEACIASLEFDYKNKTIILSTRQGIQIFGRDEIRKFNGTVFIKDKVHTGKATVFITKIAELRDESTIDVESMVEQYSILNGSNIPIAIDGIDILNQKQFEHATSVFLTN